MTLLLLETATDVCSVAVARDGVILAERTATEAHQHSSHLTLFVQEVLAGAQVQWPDIGAVVLSDGPGSYTSLRVGAATAKGFCLAWPHLELRTVSTLAALARREADLRPQQTEPILATINSRRGQVYAQLFPAPTPPVVPPQQDAPLWQSPQNLILTEERWPERVATAAGTIYFLTVGSGRDRVDAHNDRALPLEFGKTGHCTAAGLLPLALNPDTYRTEDIAAYEPLYLNPPFVTKSKKKLLGR